jgi:hypothetical protein
MGQGLWLEDFAPLIQQYRARWFPDPTDVVTCCDPAGAHDNSHGSKNSGVTVLTDHGFTLTWKENANSPAVRLAMIEQIVGYMRRRTPRGEAFGVHPIDRWQRISVGHAAPEPWEAFVGGFLVHNAPASTLRFAARVNNLLSHGT